MPSTHQHHMAERGDTSFVQEGCAAGVREGTHLPPTTTRGHHDGQQLSYGSADADRECGSEQPPATRQSDRLSPVLCSIAIVALLLSLAQVSEIRGRPSVAIGQAGIARNFKSVATGHLRQLQIAQGAMLDETAAAPDSGLANSSTATVAPASPDPTAASGTGEPAVDGSEPAAEEDYAEECCACSGAVVTGQGDRQQAFARADGEGVAPDRETMLGDAASPADAAAGADADGMSGTNATGADSGSVEVTNTTTAGEVAIAEESVPEASSASRRCCPCSGPSKRMKAKKQHVFSKETQPKTVWDEEMAVLKFIGKPLWGDGYKDVYVQNGVRMVPKAESELNRKNPSIGPRDIMVPSLEYQGTEHLSGWVVKPNVFGDGKPHTPLSENDGEKEVNSVLSDNFVDQRITHIHDPSNSRGRQLPGVAVDWSAVQHPAMESKTGPPTKRPAHIVHHDDGTISYDTVPKGSSVPYRGGLRQIVFKPCKIHPKHGCELDPPMPAPGDPPPPVEPLAEASEGGDSLPPPYIVDEESRRLATQMFDDAAALEDQKGPISADMVHGLERKYQNYLGKKPYNRWYLNVFEYMKEEYDTTPAADLAITQILEAHHYHEESMDVDAENSESATEGKSDIESENRPESGQPVDIAYGGGTFKAMEQKDVMCQPFDFSCFFGLSR